MASIKERLGTGIQRISSLSGKKKIILSVIIVLIFVSGSFAAITYLFKESPSYHSPEVDFHVSFINNTTDSYSVYSPMDQFYHITTPFNSYNMSNITVNVYATMPSFAALGDESMSVNGSITNNSIYVQLFNSTLADAHGNIHGVLSKVFHTIIKEYRQIYTKPQEKNISISMTLQADYQFVYQNKMYVYTYYNNIPFDPWNSGFGDSSFNPATFFSDIYFNMNSPPIVIPINNTTSSVNHLHKLRQIGGGGGAIRCNNEVTQQHVYQYWGPLPIIMADIPLNGSQLDYSLNNLNANFKTCIQGNSGTSTTTKWVEQTSTSGAWSDSGAQFNNSLRTSGTSGSSDPVEYNNMSMIGFGHFEYQMVFTTTQYFYVDGSYCAYGGTSSSYVLKLLNADNGTFDYISGPVASLFHIPSANLSAFVKHDWKAFFDNGLTPDQTFSNVPLGLGVNTTTFYYDANAYETVQQKAANLLNDGAMIATGVALGLVIAAIAVSAVVTDGASLLILSFTDTGIIAGGVALAAGISASIVQSQAAPMFVSSSQLQVNTIFFTNFNYIYPPGSNGSDGPMTISLYQSSSTESMVINGQEYNFNVQSPYVYAADV